MGWVANVLLIWSWWALAYKHRYALMLGVVGSMIWAIIAARFVMWDLLFIEFVLGMLQFRAWLKWGQDGRFDSVPQ